MGLDVSHGCWDGPYSAFHPNAGDPPVQRAIYDGEAAATVRFIAGLRKAAARGEPVEFF